MSKLYIAILFVPSNCYFTKPVFADVTDNEFFAVQVTCIVILFVSWIV